MLNAAAAASLAGPDRHQSSADGRSESLWPTALQMCARTLR